MLFKQPVAFTFEYTRFSERPWSTKKFWRLGVADASKTMPPSKKMKKKGRPATKKKRTRANLKHRAGPSTQRRTWLRQSGWSTRRTSVSRELLCWPTGWRRTLCRGWPCQTAWRKNAPTRDQHWAGRRSWTRQWRRRPWWSALRFVHLSITLCARKIPGIDTGLLSPAQREN